MKEAEFLQLEIPDAAAKLHSLDVATAEQWRAAYVKAHQVDPLAPQPHHARAELHDPDPVKLLSTTDSLPGHSVENSLGIVSGTAIFGADMLKDFEAGMANVLGGRASGYEASARAARDAALLSMGYDAARRGANAVVGVRLDYETLGVRNGMLMASATGTAVLVEPVAPHEA